MAERKTKITQNTSMRITIDFDLMTESDGEIFIATQDIVFDQLKYVFEKLQHKGVKITFRMEMVPQITESSTKKAEG